MNDEQLLRAAANLAEIPVSNFQSTAGSLVWFDGNNFLWNPLRDDGQAFRLAVKLKLLIGTDKNHAWALIEDDKGFSECLGDDPNKALRRAIVRAAAHLGTVGKRSGYIWSNVL